VTSSSVSDAPGEQQPPAQRRLRLAFELLADEVSGAVAAGRTPAVLDCGGGSGSLAVRLAALGAVVTVIDISADALAVLRRRAEELGVAGQVIAVQGDVEALGGLIESASVDLAVVHDVLGEVDDPSAVLAQVADGVRPGGLVSVVFANPVATVLSRALAGDLGAALAALRAEVAADDASRAEPGEPVPVTRSVGGSNRLDLAAVSLMCAQAGLQPERVQGLGVFSDWVPGADLDGHPGAAEAMRELETLAAGRAPYLNIATRLQVLARRPAAGA
jgi:SAM-dependent methyltransferase